jgi:hypothetical protein
MNEFLAPNGKPSNLTPEQYKLVRTDAFKNWFGDWQNDPTNASKVVDENGEPLVVWRGESKDFNVFEYKKLGSTLKTAWRNAGFYFSPTKQGAEQYMYFYQRGILKQFFLNIKNTYTLDSKEFFGVMDWGSLPTQRFKTNKSATDFAIKRISEIKSENYDGAFVTILENNNVVEIIAFEPEQIKLADGSNTTFDGNNTDIRFEDGGSISSGAFKIWFGNSKVVDKKGNPLKVYHGSPDLRGLKENYIFESRFSDNQSFFFTDNYSMAKSYADPQRAFDYQNAEEGVIGLYLSLQNPLIVNAFNQIWRKFETTIDGNEIIGTRNLINFAKNKGYDGVIVENVRDYYNNNDKKTKGGNVYVAFYPNQIKLADGSNTTFDSNNNDIRFDGGGLVPKTTKDEYGNWSGSYLGNKFTLYKLSEGWEYSIFYYSPIFESNQIYSSSEDYSSFNTKKDALNTLMEQIIEINLENDNFINQRQSKNPDIRFDEGGGVNKDFKYSLTFGGITIYTNTEQEYVGEKYSPFESKGSFKASVRKMDLENIAIESEQLKDFNFLWGVDDWKSISQKLKNKGINKLELYLTNGIIKTYELKVINDSDNPNTQFNKGGDTNWNVDRYREVEKEMFELRKQGKGDTIEYFKLIKERSILEQAKMNPSSDSENSFAKGGKVVVLPADIQKYKKIGIEDKYFIEASKDVGLQGINFDSKSILKRIEEQFIEMLDRYKFYLIDDDSPSITNYINNEIETHKEQGSSLETIQRLEQMKDSEPARRTIIEDISKTQKESLEKWVDYLRLSEYKLPFKFLILKAVLNFNYDLKQNKLYERGRDTIRNFTPFDAGSLAQLNEIGSDFLLKDYNIIMNENSSRILNSQEVVEQSGNGKWIKFNGGNKTKPEDIEKNGNRLMNLVQNTYWCTKSAGTSQLRGGDFYVYVTESNGEIFPRIAVRMNEDKVGEVRGNKSSAQDLDAEMLPVAEEFLNKNIPNDSGKKWLDSIKYNKKCVEMRKRFEAEGMYQDFIYDYIKLIADKDKYKVDYGQNGNVTLLEQKFEEIIKIPNEYYKKGDIVTDYRFLSPNTIYFIGNLGRYEFSYIQSNRENGNNEIRDLSNWKLKLISGYFETHPNLSNLGNIEFVGNNLEINSNTTDLGKIKYVGNELILSQSVKTLSNLESIGGGLILQRSLKDLGKLKKIGFLEIHSCDENFTLGLLEEIEGNFEILNHSVDIDFGNLKTIGGSLVAINSIVTDLKNLESVGGDFLIKGSKIKKFENLKTIGGDADFSNNFCSSTQNIETILGNIKFLNSRIMEFPKLNKIGGTIEFRGSYFKSFGNINYIGGSLNFAESKLEELGNLEYVGGYVSFKGSKIKSLDKVKKVIGFANFDGSEVEDLGDLESVGGNLYLLNSKIKSLNKLNYVGGTIMMNKSFNVRGLEGFYDIVSKQLNK